MPLEPLVPHSVFHSARNDVQFGQVVFAFTLGYIALCLSRLYGHWRSKQKRESWITILKLATCVVGYAFVLVAVGLLSQPKELKLGERKCFDDWCVSLDEVTPIKDNIRLTMTVYNLAKRKLKPDSPSIELLGNSRAGELMLPWLTESLSPESAVERRFPIDKNWPKDCPILVATEGGWPSEFVIGDENSPFHAKSYWRLDRQSHQ